MVYLELLRARRIATWYALGVFAIAVALAIALVNGTIGHVRMAIDGPSGSPDGAPVSGILAYAAFCGICTATALAASLNRETNYAQFTFVRPVSRVRMAASIVGVDLFTIVGCWFLAIVLSFAAFFVGTLGRVTFVWEPLAGYAALLGLAVGVMWYAMLQLVTAWAPPRSGRYVGITGAIFGFAIWFSQASFLGPIAYLFRAILYIDPFAYFYSISEKGDIVTLGSLIALDPGPRAVAMYGISAAALVAATYLWKRVEV